MRLLPAIALLLACVAANAAQAQRADERRLSVQERSLCEPPEGPVARPDWCEWPEEVRIYTARRDECDHWRSEPIPEDVSAALAADRGRQIDRAVAELCVGADARLRALKKRYRGDASIMRALDGYEPDIEPIPPTQHP